MRCATASVFILFVLPSALLAQPCDPAGSDVACPDTTDWHRYFPLEVGNQWQYRQDVHDEPLTHWSWTITGETEADGQTYVALERCDETDDGSATCADPVLLRYDAANDMVVRHSAEGDTWWNELPCMLGADFSDDYECAGPGTEGAAFAGASGAYGASVSVPPDAVGEDTRKGFSWLAHRDWEMFAGLGVTRLYYELQGEPTRLVYANVGGQGYGTPAFASCDPADHDSEVACPDTTDWRRYLPLAVGNEWQYREALDVDEVVYWGRRITGEVTIEGSTYFRLERCDEDADGSVTCGEPALLRYSEEYPRVVAHTEDGDVWWGGVPCHLDIPFNGGAAATESGFYECEGISFEQVYLPAWGAYEASVSISPDVVSGDTRKVIGTPIFTGTTMYAGIGPVEYVDELHPEATRLVYARIDGEEIGDRAFGFPTADEPAATPPRALGLTAVFPNPATQTVRVEYTVDDAQRITLDVIDLLGRTVRTVRAEDQSSGAYEVTLDVSGLSTGSYFVRLQGAQGAEVMQRIVVVG